MASEIEVPLVSTQRICAWTVKLAGLLILSIALSNLLLWWVPPLRFIGSWPGIMIMRANTALGLLGCSLSLLCWHLAPRDRSSGFRLGAILFASLATAIAALTAFQDLSGITLGIDEWFAPATFPEDQASRYVAAPGRMSLNAALSLFLLGLALAGLDISVDLRRARRVFAAPILAVVSALPASFALVGYITNVGGFTGILRSTNVLLHVACALLLAGVGVLALRPERQPIRRILSQGAGGTLLRWLLPGSTISLILLAWLIGRGRSWGMVATGEGTAFMLFGGLILLYALIVSASRALDVQELRARNAWSALRAEELRNQSLLKTTPDGVILMSDQGLVMDWNVAAEHIFGWQRHEVIGRKVADCVLPESDRNLLQRELQTYLNTGISHLIGHRSERVALHRDGHAFPVEFSLNAVTSADPPMFVIFVRDITSRKMAEQALREAKEHAEKASQAKDDFLAALSHELRTPLTPVLLSATELARDANLPAELRHSLAMIERNVALEARLIDDLLDLTRISRGKLLLKSELCDVNEMVRHALDIIQEDATAKSLTLTVTLTAQPSRRTGDPARLQQVFWNLLKNAIKFTPAGGTVTVSSYHDAAENGSLILEVQDTGLGFHPARADHLFLPFEQENSNAAHQFGGLGLGLAIARAIVQLHGGTIAAHSDGPGKGATFTVTLPCDDHAMQPPPPTPVSVAAPSTAQEPHSPRNILLVEDHEPTRTVLAQMLRRAGNQITTAESIAQGITTAREATVPFDLLISDLGLPDGSGLELMRQMKELQLISTGIALSGYGMEEDLRRSREAGFTSHLVKPVKFEQLQQAISALNLS